LTKDRDRAADASFIRHAQQRASPGPASTSFVAEILIFELY